MYKAAHYELVASARVVKIEHEINPEFKIGCMILFPQIYSATCNPKDVQADNDFMDITYLFGDVQVRGYYSNKANKFFERNNINIKWKKMMKLF